MAGISQVEISIPQMKIPTAPKSSAHGTTQARCSCCCDLLKDLCAAVRLRCSL